LAGAGSVGRYLIERLVSEDHEILVIDNNEAVLEELSSSFDIQTVLGSASALGTLSLTDLGKSDIFIAATSSDETNLISCLLVDSISQKISKVARVREIVTDPSGLSQRIAGVFDEFINPDYEAAAFLMRLMNVPGAVEVMEFAGGRIWVVGWLLDQDSKVVGKKLSELALGEEQLVIAAIARDGQLIIPRGGDTLCVGDEIYVALRSQHIAATLEILGIKPRPLKHVMIFGGDGVGRRLAKELSMRDIKVKLIDSDGGSCQSLASELNNVLVLRGDATDQSLLREEGIADVDVFIGATGDEEKNVLAALLAKRLGARTNAAVVTKKSYLSLIPELGIDIVVSPQIAAASKILRFVRKGTVSSAFSTRDDSAEVLEMVVSEGAKIVGTPLRDLKVPAGAILVAVIRDEEEATIPKGNTVVQSGDRVIFFVSRKALHKVQKLLDVKEPLFKK
jgi:trk system potassium uptake protein TrkA